MLKPSELLKNTLGLLNTPGNISCADAHAKDSAQACGCKPADHNPEKGQGGGQC